MIKLTDEQITAIASTPAAVVGSYVHTFARAIEAEVLRINGWQPIETAPKDGTPVLAIVAGNHPHTSNPYTASVVEIDGDHVHLHCDSEEDSWTPLKEWKLSHWMPLPAAPGDNIGDANKMAESVNAGKNVPFEAGTWEPDADGFWPELCSECGTPVRYGSRHSICGEKVQASPRATGCPDALPESFASVGANGETLGATVQSLRRDLEQWEQNEFSRAMGCPDTMDDMGRFAEVDMPAFLRKQNPA